MAKDEPEKSGDKPITDTHDEQVEREQKALDEQAEQIAKDHLYTGPQLTPEEYMPEQKPVGRSEEPEDAGEPSADPAKNIPASVKGGRVAPLDPTAGAAKAESKQATHQTTGQTKESAKGY